MKSSQKKGSHKLKSLSNPLSTFNGIGTPTLSSLNQISPNSASYKASFLRKSMYRFPFSGNIQRRSSSEMYESLIGYSKISKYPKIDKAPTSRGRCYRCDCRILKGAPRGFYWEQWTNPSWTAKKKNWKGNKIFTKRLLCYDCLVHRLELKKENIGQLSRLISQDLKKLKRYKRMKRAGDLIQSQKMLHKLALE